MAHGFTSLGYLMLQVGLKIFFFFPCLVLFSLSISFLFQKRERSKEWASSMSSRFAAVGRALCLPLRDRGSSPSAPSWVPACAAAARLPALRQGPPGSGAGRGLSASSGSAASPRDLFRSPVGPHGS